MDAVWSDYIETVAFIVPNPPEVTDQYLNSYYNQGYNLSLALDKKVDAYEDFRQAPVYIVLNLRDSKKRGLHITPEAIAVVKQEAAKMLMENGVAPLNVYETNVVKDIMERFQEKADGYHPHQRLNGREKKKMLKEIIGDYGICSTDLIFEIPRDQENCARLAAERMPKRTQGKKKSRKSEAERGI